MATTYNCVVNNVFGNPDWNNSPFPVYFQNNAFGGQGFSVNIFNTPSSSTLDRIVTKQEMDSFIESLGFLEVNVLGMAYFNDYSFDGIDFGLSPLDYTARYPSVEFADGSFAHNVGLEDHYQPIVDIFHLSPLKVRVVFTGRPPDESVISYREHEIYFNESVKIRTGSDYTRWLQSFGINATSTGASSWDTSPVIVCEDSEDSSTTTTTTVTLDQEDYTTTVINQVVGGDVDVRILQEFKTIQNADAAGTLDVDEANETLTNLYNEL